DERAAVTRQNSGQTFKERCFACAVRPDQTQDFASPHAETYVLQYRARAEFFGEAVDCQQIHRVQIRLALAARNKLTVTEWRRAARRRPPTFNGVRFKNKHCQLPLAHCALFRREVLTKPLPLQFNWQCAMCDG